MDIKRELEYKEYIGDSCGNSFVILDCRNIDLDKEFKADYAFRNIIKYGVDSALFLEKSKKCDVFMEIFEKDKTQSEACGNGTLLVSYLLGLDKGKIEMKNSVVSVEGDLEKISIILGTEFSDFKIVSDKDKIMFVKIGGEPHQVHLIKNGIKNFDLNNLGESEQKKYNGGVNVDIVEKIDDTHYLIRTYERGVFDETKSCGTGSLSSYLAVSYFNDKIFNEPVEFTSEGGVHWVSRLEKKLKLETRKSFCKIRVL